MNEWYEFTKYNRSISEGQDLLPLKNTTKRPYRQKAYMKNCKKGLCSEVTPVLNPHRKTICTINIESYCLGCERISTQYRRH